MPRKNDARTASDYQSGDPIDAFSDLFRIYRDGDDGMTLRLVFRCTRVEVEGADGFPTVVVSRITMNRKTFDEEVDRMRKEAADEG